MRLNIYYKKLTVPTYSPLRAQWVYTKGKGF